LDKSRRERRRVGVVAVAATTVVGITDPVAIIVPCVVSSCGSFGRSVGTNASVGRRRWGVTSSVMHL
jgi:hypothetical protein